MTISDFRLLLERGVALLSLLVALTFLAFLTWSSYYGLDLSDESAQLNWMAHPWLYDASVTQYGYILHPFFELLGNDIALIRQFNFLTLYLACFLAVYALLQLSPLFLKKTKERLAISGVLATGIFWFFQTLWITVPGYNSLTLIALCVIAAAFILVYSDPQGRKGWVALGAGGWLALMAKPTSAFMLLVLAVLFLTVSRLWSSRGILSGGLALVLLVVGSALLIDGSIVAFTSRLAEGAEWAKVLGGGHTLKNALRLDDFSLSVQQITIFWLLLAVGFLSVLLDSGRDGAGAWMNIVLAFVVTIATLACFVFWEELNFSRYRHFQVLPLTGFPAGMIVASLFEAWRKEVKLRWRTFSLMLVFIALPYAYVFGTISGYWKVGPSAGIFWIMAGVAFYLDAPKRESSLRPVLLLAVIVQFSAVVFVNGAMKAPYRQPQPLWSNDKVALIGAPASEIVMEEEMGEYIIQLKQIARQAGFEKDDPAIDLSGHYPGALFAIGARSLGSAWLIGGYPGSLQLAYLGLSSHSCTDIANAWVLDEPEGPRRIDSSLLERFGIKLEEDFVVVGRLKSPPGQFPKKYDHVLYKPLRSEGEAVDACEQVKPEAGDKTGNNGSVR